MKTCALWAPLRTVVAAVLVACLLGGCLSKEESSFSTADVAEENQISGSVGDGPIVGATIRVFQKDGIELAQLDSGANANYNVTVKAKGKDYALQVKATGGMDLVTNLAPDFAMGSAVLRPNKRSVSNINPFSTITVALAEELPGGSTAENLEIAQQIVSTRLNAGLSTLAATGPMTTEIDERNIVEVVKASETLAEAIRRVRELMRNAGFILDADAVVAALSSDLTDEVIDGRGGARVDARIAAVATIAYAQVVMESMANELHVGGVNATQAIENAIAAVTLVAPENSLDDIPITREMISRTRVGLAAAYAVSPDPAIRDLHAVVSGLQDGQSPALVRIAFPAGYRTTLGTVIDTIAGADQATIDLVNSIARTSGDLEPTTNRQPAISGTPASSVNEGQAYSFTPTASDADGDSLTFSISGLPAWASFDANTGMLSGAPHAADVGVYANIVISVSDGQASASLPAFSITVNAVATNNPPQIAGTPASNVNEGQAYLFTPTASDADGDSLTFSISGLPAWASFDVDTGMLSGTPQAADIGVYANIVISVSDGQASASLPAFSIAVDAISLGSVTLSWTPPTQNEDGSTLTNLAGYRLYWGTVPGSYPNSVTIDNPSVTNYVVENLAPGTYEFVATSFNASGVESGFSNATTKVVE